MEGQRNPAARIRRTIATAAIIGFAVPLVDWFVMGPVAGDSGLAQNQPDLRLMIWLASFLVVGIVAAVGAFMIAGTGDHRRGRAAVVLVAAMIASITLGQLAIDLLFDAEDREAGLGSLVVSSVIISAIPVTLGTVLGYAFGSDRRPA